MDHGTFPNARGAILPAIANHLVENRLYDRKFVRRWWLLDSSMVHA